MKIVILGLAKTGTTALFFKIKNSLGLDTLSFFEPLKIEASQLEFRKNVLVKELLWSNNRDYEIYPSFDKKILILRDPRDYCISSLIYSSFFHGIFTSKESLKKIFDLFVKKENNSDSISFIKLQKEIQNAIHNKSDFLMMWKDQLNRFISFHKKNQEYFLFQYEDLINSNFSALEEYLGFDLYGSSNVDNSLSRVVRSKKSNNWKSWFTQDDILYFKDHFREFMIEYPYFNDWSLNIDRSIPSREVSDYIIRLLKERVVSTNSKDAVTGIIKDFLNEL